MAASNRCARCWGRSGLQRFSLPEMRPVQLCKSCREEAPKDALVFREVFLRFSTAKELLSHYSAKDEREAIRKLCNEQRLDFRRMWKAIESQRKERGRRPFLDFTRPYGYEMRDGGLVVRPEEARTVGLIFEMYLDGKGVAKISEELNGHQIPTKTGKRWASQTVANILRNPLYCGMTRDDGPLRNGDHRPIVDPETFSRAQVELSKRIRRPDQRHEARLLEGR